MALSASYVTLHVEAFLTFESLCEETEANASPGQQLNL